MKASLQRLLTLLAASGLSDRMIFDALREVELYGPKAVVEMTRTLRNEIDRQVLPSIIPEHLGAGELDFGHKSSRADLQITKLLRETGLPSTVIAERLLTTINS